MSAARIRSKSPAIRARPLAPQAPLERLDRAPARRVAPPRAQHRQRIDAGAHGAARGPHDALPHPGAPSPRFCARSCSGYRHAARPPTSAGPEWGGFWVKGEARGRTAHQPWRIVSFEVHRMRRPLLTTQERLAGTPMTKDGTGDLARTVNGSHARLRRGGRERSASPHSLPVGL